MSDGPGRLDPTQWRAARLWALSRLPYLSQALLTLPVEARPGTGTVSIDLRWRVAADPATVAGWSPAALGSVLVHLLGHALRDHGRRALEASPPDGQPPGCWLLAADAEINDDLAEVGVVPTVAPDLPEHWGAAAGQLAEAYLADLPASARRRGTLDCGSGADGTTRPWDPQEEGKGGSSGDQADGRDGAGGEGDDDRGGLARWEQRRLQRRTAEAVLQQAGQLPGTVPGGWQRWAHQETAARVDWRRILAAELRRAVGAAAGCVDFTYRRPSRRAGAVPDVVLPYLYRPVPQLAVVCDTSGSMDEELLAAALGEIDGILRATGRRQPVPVLACDTEVHATTLAGRAAAVTLAGGGGTDMGAGLAAAVRLRPRPDVVVVLTDGFTPWPDRSPPAKVIVGILSGRHGPRRAPHGPPWARTVPIDP